MADPERLLLEIAVSVRQEHIILAQRLVQGGNGDSSGILDAGQRDRFKPRFGKEIEAIPGPLSSQFCALLMTSVPAVLIGENHRKAILQCLHQCDGGCAGRLVLLPRLVHGEDVEVEASVLDGFGTLQRPLRNRQQRQSWRQCERLLAAGCEIIDGSHFPQMNGHCCRTGDGIDQQEHIVLLSHHLGDVSQRAHHTGAGFIVNDGHGIEIAA